MGPRRSSSSSSAYQATPQRRNERRSTLTTDAFYGLGIAIILFASGTIVWSTRHLNRINIVSTSSISNSKAHFLGEDQFAKDDKLELQKEEVVLSLDDIPLPDSGDGAIIPFDLSVNFLQRIVKAPGAPPEPPMVAHASKARVEEDFLPVVPPSSVNFRWRHRARVGSSYEDASNIQGYRIIVRQTAAAPIISNEAVIRRVECMKEEISSVLLVMSGLGSFRASFDGVPLSTSGPIDPPFTDYSKRIIRPKSANEMANWQVTRGHIRESDLFTGEMIDLNVFAAMEGWDTTNGWQDEAIGIDGIDPYMNIDAWVKPVSYRTEVTQAERKQEMAIRSSALHKNKTKYYPRRKQVASPLGQLVPSEIPPILPMERIAPDEIHDLGSGRWLLDFGRAFSGMLHFDKGLPQPIIPHNNTYPRAHGFRKEFDNDSFITIVYGESLELTTGDINRVLVAGLGPGPEMGLFARIVPGEKRCVVFENWFKREGSVWPGDEEKRFMDELSAEDTQFLFDRGELKKAKRKGNRLTMTWSMWEGFHEGIFSMRYSLSTLSEMGFHHIALRKASGTGMATFEYLLRHNATTMWESWWRSEDLYSRNHPMLGAFAEWMSSSVAGVSVHPTTVGGRQVLFWPQFPKSAKTLEYASAIQGTPQGDFAVAWRFEDLPEDKNEYDSALVMVRIRLLVPPGGEGFMRPPFHTEEKFTIKHALSIPDLLGAKSAADGECSNRREARMGFPYSWEYDRINSRWYRLRSSKSIGTPCLSFLNHKQLAA
ncbi:alpha-L-rhamnosidase [Skeletonema marinoi]|uniref:Alpha-L-rhamnosidase n=1 Tax=Skeletonema marinoi TaxID=267567 RepID=A0AAD9DIM8_9STRA|nr:alpha-L-rhamnosidase [Skeletonema marinoi]